MYIEKSCNFASSLLGVINTLGFQGPETVLFLFVVVHDSVWKVRLKKETAVRPMMVGTKWRKKSGSS